MVSLHCRQALSPLRDPLFQRKEVKWVIRYWEGGREEIIIPDDPELHYETARPKYQNTKSHKNVTAAAKNT